MTAGPNRRTPSPDPQAGAFVVPATLAPGAVLSPGDLAIAGERLFGRWGWQTRLAEALEIDGSTVRRWVSGAAAVPNPAKIAIRLMLLTQEAGALLSPPMPTRPETRPEARSGARPTPSRPRSTTLARERGEPRGGS